MLQFRRALFVGLALSMIVPSPFVVGKGDPAGKVRGRIQDYERARRLLVVYTKNHVQQAQDAVRETKFFHVVEHERAMNALRCRWDGNDRRRWQTERTSLAQSTCLKTSARPRLAFLRSWISATGLVMGEPCQSRLSFSAFFTPAKSWSISVIGFFVVVVL
jgi:hypothetical protein